MQYALRETVQKVREFRAAILPAAHAPTFCWHRQGPEPMNLEKFTERARGFLQSGQTVASRMTHQRIARVYVLKALLEDEQAMGAGLIAPAGGSAEAARR